MQVHIITPEELDRRIAAAVAPLHERIEYLESTTDKYLSQKDAMKATGLSKSGIISERKRPGTLLVFKMEGETGKKPVYCAMSIKKYNKSKQIKRHYPKAA